MADHLPPLPAETAHHHRHLLEYTGAAAFPPTPHIKSFGEARLVATQLIAGVSQNSGIGLSERNPALHEGQQSQRSGLLLFKKGRMCGSSRPPLAREL